MFWLILAVGMPAHLYACDQLLRSCAESILPGMVLTTCEFETERLLAKEWHSLALDDWRQRELEDVVVVLLTGSVTLSLPPA